MYLYVVVYMYLCMRRRRLEEKTARSVVPAEIRVNGKIYYTEKPNRKNFYHGATATTAAAQQLRTKTTTTKTTNDTTKIESVHRCFVYFLARVCALCILILYLFPIYAQRRHTETQNEKM